ncbi:phosphoribosylanthranilate isomerase [Rossellomorea vietnamensis]|uniref:N-(5'-phosphoribosyl)anthranilate isomerase n=1 Tax=Rossellomorea vietnamensis TaxID=218284 RepID=A0A5D4NZC6_9BACI|nr:phosphoribosylanthranilate isomerase [Rossellomorea vietnamensis]TYS18746.1 phosphoribosylanthranilate isomerase [Rossellomorea vietnamensis]
MVKVKICGIMTVEHAEAAVHAGVDAVGFIFAESRRRISPEAAKKIGGIIPASVLKIGVFVDASKKEIEETAETAGLDYVQLHGSETAEFMESLAVPAFKAISIKKETDLSGIERYPGSMVLVDSGHGAGQGGSGLTFDWSYLKDLSIPHNIILAGGLTADNIEAAIEEVNPFMIDVSSGVETGGTKDIRKMVEFLNKAKDITTKKEEIK